MPITGIQQKIGVKFALFGAFYLLLIKPELVEFPVDLSFSDEYDRYETGSSHPITQY